MEALPHLKILAINPAFEPGFSFVVCFESASGLIWPVAGGAD
jgi:hypothetical protein